MLGQFGTYALGWGRRTADDCAAACKKHGCSSLHAQEEVCDSQILF